MNLNDWQTRFRDLYDRGTLAWKRGRKEPNTMFNEADAQFLTTIGCTRRELFDYIDDEQRYGEPDFQTALEVAALRRDYFLNVLKGKSTGRIVSMDDLPPKQLQVDGIAWLPRIIEKARIKLRGEMPDDLMYGCGGDRDFLREMKMSAPQFLKLVWDCGDDNRRVIDVVKKSAGRV